MLKIVANFIWTILDSDGGFGFRLWQILFGRRTMDPTGLMFLRCHSEILRDFIA
jgi:hypothetical protein